MLEEEIKSNQKRINTLEKDAQKVKEELQRTLSALNFSDICSLFQVANDSLILHHDNIQKQKLQNLLMISSNNIFGDNQNLERAILNFYLYKLTDGKNNILCKGIVGTLPPQFIKEGFRFLL